MMNKYKQINVEKADLHKRWFNWRRNENSTLDMKNSKSEKVTEKDMKIGYWWLTKQDKSWNQDKSRLEKNTKK